MKKEEIIKYIGKASSIKNTILCNGSDGEQHLLDVRGWGHLMNKFNQNNHEAAEFQDALSQFITDAINAKLASPAIDGWISVDERLPENREEVMCYRRRGYRMLQTSWEAHTDQNKQWFIKAFSHWQPLPPPPSISDLPKKEGESNG